MVGCVCAAMPQEPCQCVLRYDYLAFCRSYFNTAKSDEIDNGWRSQARKKTCCAVLFSKTSRFTMRNGTFWNAKRLVSQCRAAHFQHRFSLIPDVFVPKDNACWRNFMAILWQTTAHTRFETSHLAVIQAFVAAHSWLLYLRGNACRSAPVRFSGHFAAAILTLPRSFCRRHYSP